MATNAKMKCPHCGTELDLDELYMTQMSKEYEKKNEVILHEAIKHMEEENDKKLAEAVRAAESKKGQQIEELLAQIKSLTEANDRALKERQDMMDREIALKQRMNEIELEAQKKVSEQMEEIFKKAKENADEEKAAEIAALKKKVEDANEATEAVKRKLEQGSQQLQGEVQELELEECLRTEFPLDIIEEVEKGRNGADVIQTVVSKNGKVCGKIVWESKNVKNWSNAFIPKLRNDMNDAKGDGGILVSNVFGKDMVEFTQQDGVWLVKPSGAMAMARLIRERIISVSDALVVVERKVTIQDAVYAYVTSAEFRNKLENIGRKYLALKTEIEDTERSIAKHYRTQKKLIDELVGDTDGIIGEVNAYLLQAGPENVPREEIGEGE